MLFKRFNNLSKYKTGLIIFTFMKQMLKMSVASAKSVIRSNMKMKLSNLSKENIDIQSRHIINQLINMPEYLQSTRIGLYLSMPEEVNTDELVEHVLNNGKECFIPRYTKNSFKMEMVKLKSLVELDELPKDKWNVRQPLLSEEREDAYMNGGLDLIIIPGLAFSSNGKRLGRGKGYYDRYLQAMKTYRKDNGYNLHTIGIGFAEQILDDIPTDDTDFVLDRVVYKDV